MLARTPPNRAAAPARLASFLKIRFPRAPRAKNPGLRNLHPQVVLFWKLSLDGQIAPAARELCPS
jgi:hypothetical protein